MFEDHPSFEAPKNLEQNIWRYLDFTKFVDLLVTNDLYFTRVDQFEDKFEGSNTKPTVKSREAFFKHLVSIGEMNPKRAQETSILLEKHYMEQRKHYLE